MRTTYGRLEGAVGRVPMVRLVLVWLLVITVAALVGSAVGVVQFSLPALLAGLVVAVPVTVIGTLVMARIVRAPANLESSIVTGLILFMIAFPATDAVSLLLLAGAALVADASKYLLTIRGRHVLNPAAAGVFVAGLTGQFASVWWVGSPALLPFVAIAAVLIGVRTRMLGPVLVLVVVGWGAAVAGGAVHGFDVGQAAASAILSSPVVFLAGVMFTEPITLPPRRLHRYAEAVVVGLVFALPYLAPFRLLTLGPTPELALLTGNVLAAVLARPIASRLTLIGSRPLTATSTEFAFRPDRPLPHAAGQYLELHVPHRSADRRGSRRSLTIVSKPGEEDGTVKVAVRTHDPGSSFKRALASLPVGSPVRAVTVTGGFVLPADRSVPLVLVASGIGITPFVSQLRAEAAEAGAPRDVLLVYRVASAADVPYRDELAATGVRTLLVVPDGAALPPLPDHWHVAARLDEQTLRGVLPEPATRTAYVSGSPAFVGLARDLLGRLGVRRVRTDAFAGY